jgi:hypothetical protein
MVATIAQMIGKVSPKFYAQNGSELLKKYGSYDKIPAEEIKPRAVTYLNTTPQGLKEIPVGATKLFKSEGTEASFNLMYDSPSEKLEPVYFFILDLMESFGLKPEKLIDNFSSTPGSGHFSELGTKATAMQQQASSLMGNINTVLRSVLNLIYDLRDFRIRLQSYEDLKSEDKNKSEAAKLSLKQIWIDKVDIQKGNSSVKAMAFGQGGFVTLLDAFLVAKDEKDVDKLDLNDRVKRILKPRIFEFNNWLKQSEQELRKRYEIEKTYLKSQVSSLKLYSRWAKPYLKAATDLEQKNMGRTPDFVKTFDTIILELTLLGKNQINPGELALQGEFPRDFAKESYSKKFKRKYYSCILVDFRFRGIPQKVSQQGHYAFGGRVEVSFKAYALNEDELKALEKEIEKSDVGDVLQLIEGTTKESLGQLQDEIDFYLNEPEEEEKKEKSGNVLRDLFEPFSALLGAYDKPEKPKEKKSDDKKPKNEIVKIDSDNWYETEFFRKTAAKSAIDTAYSLFDLYKKAHGMPSYS